LGAVPEEDKIILLGDFSARVGADSDGSGGGKTALMQMDDY